MKTEARTSRRAQGFTLLELVVAITVGAIVMAFAAMLVTAPVDAYMNQSGRSVLTDASTSVAQHLEQDLRMALPNSVSITTAGNHSIIEMLIVEQVVFYRGPGELGDAMRELSFAPSPPDMDFAVFGRFNPAIPGDDLNNRYLVVGNVGRADPARDAYHLNAGPGVIIPGDRQITISPGVGNEELVQLPAPFSFLNPNLAPADPLNPTRVVRNRMFLIRYPVTYICNSSANARSVRRYAAYSINPNIATAENSAELAGAQESLLANNVGACQIRCASGGATEAVCRDTLSVQIDFERTDTAGDTERVHMLRQFDMDNDL